MTTQAKPLSAEDCRDLKVDIEAPGWQCGPDIPRRLLATIEALTAKQEWDVEKVAEAIDPQAFARDPASTRFERFSRQDAARDAARRVASQFTPPSQGWQLLDDFPNEANVGSVRATDRMVIVLRKGNLYALDLPPLPAPPIASPPEEKEG